LVIDNNLPPLLNFDGQRILDGPCLILSFNIFPKPSKIAWPLTLALSTVGERVGVRRNFNHVWINLSDDRKN